jgi:putative transposase
MSSGRAFLAMDRLLDRCDSGPLYLRQPEIARVLVQAVYEGQDRFRRYELHAFVVMPNHAHLLVTPRVNARNWLGPLKGFTAHQANQLLRRDGPFWQNESYDHLISDDRELQRVLRYIEQNPVRAGLVKLPEEYPWSSASPGGSRAAG